MRTRGYALLGVLSVAACGGEFDTERHPPPRGSLGRELYSVVCDRVGAQSLREDVSGASFRTICHPAKDGQYGTKVDESKLVPLDRNAVNLAGDPVPLDVQKRNRAYEIARIEALGARREELIRALDEAFPDVTIPVKDASTCTAAKQPGRLLPSLKETLSRMVPLHLDGTTPAVTRATGKLLQALRRDGEAQDALARFDARQGYLPLRVAPGLLRPLLSYPRLFELSDALLRTISSDADPHGTTHAPGAAYPELLQLFSVLQPELANAEASDPLAALTINTDPVLLRPLLSRPRTTLELGREVLLAEDPVFAQGAPSFIVRRDARGYALVPRVSAPFVDSNGDGLADVDPLGQFVTADGSRPPTPFVLSLGSKDGARDELGRVSTYGYVDANTTFVAPLLRDMQPLFDDETVMDLLAGFPVVMGPRAESDTNKIYTDGAKVSYKPFVAEASPVLDLAYAVGQIAADPALDDALSLFRTLMAEHPDEVARLIAVALHIKQVSDAHPEATLPEASTYWDETLDVVARIAAVQDPTTQRGILEDLLHLVGTDNGPKMAKVFAAFFKYRDELTYDRNNLNGPAWNLTTAGISPPVTLVDRSKPDTGGNRSLLQRMLQLLHDIKDESVCTKEGAVVHIDIKWPPGSLGIPIKLDYPTSSLTPLVCAFVGAPSPDTSKGLPKCSLFQLENLSNVLMDLIVGKLELGVHDPCLKALLDNKVLTGLVGGADAVVEEMSGIKGFTLHPNVNGFARLAHYDTAHDGLPGDTTASTAKTHRFIVDVINPIETNVCPPDPFTTSDGTKLNLRKCATFDDTLRGRDRNVIFPLEQLDFIPSVAPLARAFTDNKAPLLFVDLFDVLHLHYGSKGQSTAECNPSAPRTDARWCSQDGIVKYEPILVDMMESDLFPALRALMPIIEATKIQHCDAFDSSGRCTRKSERDGVKVLAELVRALVDPARSKGLVDRRGNAFAVRNDGSKVPQVTPIYLLIDSLKGFDRGFSTWAAAHPDDANRKQGWARARSRLVDTFVAIEGAATTATWKNKAIPKIVPKMLDVLQAQILAHCPDRTPGTKCAWAQKQFAAGLTETVSGPTFAASVDLLDAIRKDAGARAELQQLLRYLSVDAANDAGATTLTAVVDLVQLLSDDENLRPFLKLSSSAFAPKREDGTSGVALAGIDLLSRIFATAHDTSGKELCAKEVDPDRALAHLLANLVRPREDGRIPLFVIGSVMADVNRKFPGSPDKLNGLDYANIARETSDMLLDRASGLEQFYAMLEVLSGR